MEASKLIKDLSHVSNIVGALGLSIAAAQKALDANYLDGVERLIVLANMMLDPKKKGGGGLTAAEKASMGELKEILYDLLGKFAPSHYQYTETTLDVKLDLAQSLDLNATVGLGAGYGAVTVNAAFTIGYGYDYRAAAECRTVIHAIPPNPVVFNKLLDQAATFKYDPLTLPEKETADAKLIEQSGKILTALSGGTEVEIPEKKTS